jgi:hypothetical protein
VQKKCVQKNEVKIKLAGWMPLLNLPAGRWFVLCSDRSKESPGIQELMGHTEFTR